MLTNVPKNIYALYTNTCIICLCTHTHVHTQSLSRLTEHRVTPGAIDHL